MSAAAVEAPASSERRATGIRTVVRVEIAKIASQTLPRVAAAACLVAPFAFAIFINTQASVPGDSLFGRWVHTSGFAIPLVVLGFAGVAGFPLLASVVAGDIFASEDGHATWKTVLTRSCSRGQVFWGKTLAAMVWSTAMVGLLAVSGILAGLIVVGRRSLIGLSGQVLSPGRALVLVLAGYAMALLPTLAFACIGILLSVTSRASMVGVLGPPVIGLAMVLVSFLGSGLVVRSMLLSTPFDAWHGLLIEPATVGPFLVGLLVCAAVSFLCLDAARRSFRRRDFAGDVRPGMRWSNLGRGVLVAAGIVTVLAVGTSVDRTWITSSRLERSVGTTFRNLVVVQQGILGHTEQARSLQVQPFCKRESVVTGTGEGAGDDWRCQLFVNGPRLHGVSASYSLTVRPNGCYTAEGPPSVIGPLHLRSRDGRIVVNPLYAFDGCMVAP